MQVVIEKLQAGAQKAQEVARKIESPPPTADAEETLVSLFFCRFHVSLIVILTSF